MINPGKSFNLDYYIEILLRRKWYILIPSTVMLIAAVAYAFTVSPKYLASTTILVTPQRVPEDYVRPTVTMGIEARLKSISQEVMSRTRLEKVIAEFNLYSEEAQYLKMEEIIELMRENIWVKLGGREGHFSISYIGKDPKVVTSVANKLAALYIEENMKIREQQAQGTTEFLSHELATMKAKLEVQENTITNFKRQHLYELPEQVGTNLSILSQLQKDHERISNSLKAAQERKLIIQKQLSEMKVMIASLAKAEIQEEATHSGTSPDPSKSLSSSSPKTKKKNYNDVQLNQLKNHLVELQAKYKEKHPDIVATKKRIADLEKKVEEVNTSDEEGENVNRGQAGGEETPTAASKKVKEEEKGGGEFNFFSKELENQLAATEQEVQRLKEEDSKIRGKIGIYQARIESTPTRELGLISLSRDYNNTKEAYNSLLKKSLEAKQAENLEHRQKGEQFKILDPARIPEKPFKPNKPKIIGLGFLVGISLGFGVAFLKEQTDQSFKDVEDLETTLGLKVLASIPNLKREIKKAA